MRVSAKKILAILAEMYPDARCELEFSSPFQLLIATILSAQSTDVQVNKVTKGLFARYPTAEAMMKLSEQELAEEIKMLGLFRNKSKNIAQTCRILVEKYDGQVPEDREALEALPGVGRKTASVVLSNAFGIPALAVDTHVQRVSNRLKLVNSKTPLETERQLTKKVPKSKWLDTHHQLIWHGRRLCTARNPKCSRCDLFSYCAYAQANIDKVVTE
jgi:endonuclease-3